jgi:hypothetical protein
MVITNIAQPATQLCAMIPIPIPQDIATPSIIAIDLKRAIAILLFRGI